MKTKTEVFSQTKVIVKCTDTIFTQAAVSNVILVFTITQFYLHK